ncbi:hypothetical protein, partial [Evtepia sp.]|uniref:hypothetical protein n=1 Tax=Evtepia sp. TaxID=2773933 RepID=UPI002A8227B2
QKEEHEQHTRKDHLNTPHRAGPFRPQKIQANEPGSPWGPAAFPSLLRSILLPFSFHFNKI